MYLVTFHHCILSRTVYVGFTEGNYCACFNIMTVMLLLRSFKWLLDYNGGL